MRVEVIKLEGLVASFKCGCCQQNGYAKLMLSVLKKWLKMCDSLDFVLAKYRMPVIEKRFGNIVLREVASELMQSGFQQAVTDEKLKVAGSPEVKPGEIDKEKDLQFEVSFETYPEVNVSRFPSSEGEKLQAEVTEEDVETNARKIAHNSKPIGTAVDRLLQLGDRVLIDFDGFIEGKPFPGGSGKNFTLELGSRQMIPGFEEGLLNAKAGDDLKCRCDLSSRLSGTLI